MPYCHQRLLLQQYVRIMNQTTALVGPDDNEVVSGVVSETDEVAIASLFVAATNPGKLVYTSAFVDRETKFNMLNNFKVPISLFLFQNLGGANEPKRGP